MARKSGKTGFVALGATRLKCDEWDANIEGDLPDMSSFEDAGGRFLVPGVIISDATISGPVDVGATAINATQEYTVHLGYDAGLEVAAVMRCKSININNKYRDGPRFKARFESSDGTATFAGIS